MMPITRAVGRCFCCVGMVAVLCPAARCDYMPVFEGGRGIGKTSALEAIGGDWYAENHGNSAVKDFMQSLRVKCWSKFPKPPASN